MPPMTPTTSIDTSVSNSSNTNTRPIHSPRHDRSRTLSVSSDRPSTIAHSLMSLPLAVSPEAAFIAASAASQIVTNDHDSHSETWYDQIGIEPSGETALVSNGALQLANNFIDQLLFNIIAVARSTKLSALRPAVSDVLKPHLAKDAISQADEELKEYLGGGEVDELVQSPTEDISDNWDLELVWKRTRLRCMVYSSLGDMEEEDEDYYMEQEHLNEESDDLSDSNESVSPAVAIFLTSILEYMGEQVLVVAGQAAFARLRTKYEKELKDNSRSAGDIFERVVVEDLDMERVALDRTLGRLWRSWKKRIRSPTEPNFARPFTRSAGHSRRGSSVTEAVHTLSSPREESAGKETEGLGEEATNVSNPFDVPLPMGDNDVAEIEVPGLVSYSDDEQSEAEAEDEFAKQKPRPKSLMIFSSRLPEAPLPPSPRLSQPHTPIHATRRRANSLPIPAGSPYTSPAVAKADDPFQKQNHEETGDTTAETPSVVVSKTADASETTAERNVNEDGVSPLDTDASDYAEGKTPEDTSPISMIVSGAAALGTAAVVGVTAMAQGTVPQTVATPIEEDEIEEFIEEPEIMTSSRVSYGGRSSPSASESGIDRPTRPPSMILGRSNSVRSVRVIDVQGPRTPSIKSRNGSIDVPDMPTRPASISREGSVSTPPIVEEGSAATEVSTAKATKRNAAVNVPSAEEPRDLKPAREASPSGTFVPKPLAPTSAPAHALRQATTSAPVANEAKINVLGSSAAGRSFLDLDNKPEVPQKAPLQQQYQQQYHQSQRYPSPLPTVPEKSSARKPSIDRGQPNVRGSPESPTVSRPKLNDSPSSSASNKYKPMRNSDEGSSQRPQDVAKNFEELLQNNQTIQYTLTPENMRDIDSKRSGSPVIQHKSRRSVDVKQAERSRSSSLKRSLSVTKSAGLNSHPPDHQANKPNGKLAGPVPRAPPVSMANFHARGSGAGQARDARIPRESVSDFADFIRSTGPVGGNAPAARATPVGGAMQHGRNASGSASQTSSADTTRPRQGSINRVRLQARDAAVSASNESSDLIDFIRRGPPNAGNNPRIPRNVAPFRNTMDSDQMQMSGAGGGKAIDANIPEVRHSRASTGVTETSLPSSINSQSALLNQAKKPTNYTNNFDEDDMMPKRKQRRVRDPYAIDFSDEEEEDDDDDDFDIAPPPKPKAKKEESLIDFLNSYEPPVESAPPQAFITSQTPQSAPKKKASAPSLMSRFRSAGAGSSSATKNNGFTGNQPRSVSSQTGSGKGHTPISAHMPSSVAAFSNQPPPSGNRTASSSSGGRVLMKRYEPREAASSGMGRTSDLASFLRDSEPPSSTMAAPLAQPETKSSSGISSVFGRRKKSIAY